MAKQIGLEIKKCMEWKVSQESKMPAIEECKEEEEEVKEEASE